MWKKVAINKIRKGDQIFFGNKFGYYEGMRKAHITYPKGEAPVVAPYGVIKGHSYVEVWDPNTGYGRNISTFIPKDKIKRARRYYKSK